MANEHDDAVSFEILKDFGSFGEGRWQKHLTYIKWGNNEPKFDIRPWNEDMTKMGKGVTLTDADLYDLSVLIEEALGGDDSSEDSEDDLSDQIEGDDYDDDEDGPFM